MARRDDKKNKRVEVSRMIVTIIPLESASYVDRFAASKRNPGLRGSRGKQIVLP